ncbi:zinc ribbon domain-containing protein [Methylibium sp.]|uniref:FmdB family zinc ribbon protein n=1 Tax=Methylibium sp. TaxID=2067992 RepID=UPI003340EDCD
MPTYDYACPACGGFDAFRTLAARNEPAACPDCQRESPRVFVSAPRLALMAGSTRSAIEVNERARHEPKSSRDYQRLKHPSGCGCCSSGSSSRRGATVTAANGAKAFPSKRPWMISH